MGRLLNRDKLNASNKQRGYYIYYCQKTAKVYVSKKTLKYKVLDLDSNLDFQKSFLKYILKRLSKNQQLMPTENDNFVMTMNVLDFRNNIDKLYLNVKNLQEIDSLLEFQPEFLNFKIDYDILFPMVTVIIKKNKETVYSVGPSKEFCFEMLYLKKNESNKVIKKSIEEALQNQLYQHEFQTIFNFINKKCSIGKVIDVEKVKWINKRIKNVSIGLKILSILTFPLFLICQLVIDIHAVFQKNVKWDTIPHKGKNK